jgi:hypothetical protein
LRKKYEHRPLAGAHPHPFLIKQLKFESYNIENLSTVTYGDPIKKYAQVTPSAEFPHFYFRFTIVMNISKNPNFFIEVLDELELFIDKKVIFGEKKISVGPPLRCLPSDSKFIESYCFQAPGANSVG